MPPSQAHNPISTHLRKADLCARYGVSTQTRDRMTKRPGFPPPVMITDRTPVWRVADLDQWDESRIAQRPQRPPAST